MASDLIVFGEDWGRHPSSTQHIIKHLLNDRKILWVNSIGLRRPKLNAYDIKRAWSKLSDHQQPILNKQVCHTNLTITSPLAIPWPGNSWASFVNKHWLASQINKQVSKAKLNSPILWTSLPTTVDVLGQCHESAVVYYCGDDFSALAGVDHEAVSKMEQRLANKADLILVASEQLAEKFPAQKTHLILHGVDWDLFATTQTRPADLPSNPVAGYYGNIADWIDQDLLIKLAQQLPDWHFVLIGPIQTNVDKLKEQTNIVLLDAKQHHQLPAYVQHWDVSLLPFKDNAQIKACNPLKLREYLAVGKPIVSINFPAIESYRQWIYTAQTPAEFKNVIKQAQQEIKERHQQRSESIKQESWQSKAKKINNLLSKINPNTDNDPPAL